jgi:hypothetical protein
MDAEIAHTQGTDTLVLDDKTISYRDVYGKSGSEVTLEEALEQYKKMHGDCKNTTGKTLYEEYPNLKRY